MAFLDDLKRNATGAADIAVKKTNEFANIAKLKMSVRASESKLGSVYEEIGRLFYSAERSGEDCTSEIAAYIMKADKLKADIASAKRQLAKLRNVKVCAACGNEIEDSALFCSFCGAKQEAEEIVPDVEPEEEVEDVVQDAAEAVKDAAEEAKDTVEDIVEEIKDTFDNISEN